MVVVTSPPVPCAACWERERAKMSPGAQRAQSWGRAMHPRGRLSAAQPLCPDPAHLWDSGQNKFLLAFPTWSSGDQPLRATSPSGTLRHPVGAPSEHPRGCLQEKPPHSPRGEGCLFGTPPSRPQASFRAAPALSSAASRGPPNFSSLSSSPRRRSIGISRSTRGLPRAPHLPRVLSPWDGGGALFGVMSSRSLCFPFRTAWRGPRCPATSRF